MPSVRELIISADDGSRPDVTVHNLRDHLRAMINGRVFDTYFDDEGTFRIDIEKTVDPLEHFSNSDLPLIAAMISTYGCQVKQLEENKRAVALGHLTRERNGWMAYSRQLETRITELETKAERVVPDF